MKNFYVTVSNPCFYDVLLEDSEQGETNWTISRNARSGDWVLLYICAPVSAIVAVATVATEPVKDDNPSSEWFGHFLADMHSLRMLAEPITRDWMLKHLSSWRYWTQPRNSVCVPEQYRAVINGLLKNDASAAA
jgi:hypothetical protein